MGTTAVSRDDVEVRVASSVCHARTISGNPALIELILPCANGGVAGSTVKIEKNSPEFSLREVKIHLADQSGEWMEMKKERIMVPMKSLSIIKSLWIYEG